MFSDSDDYVHDEIAPKLKIESTKTAQKAEEQNQIEKRPD